VVHDVVFRSDLFDDGRPWMTVYFHPADDLPSG
jgi:hypothetical protein